MCFTHHWVQIARIFKLIFFPPVFNIIDYNLQMYWCSSYVAASFDYRNETGNSSGASKRDHEDDDDKEYGGKKPKTESFLDDIKWVPVT